MKKRKTFTFDSRTAQAVEMASKKLNMTMSNIVEVSFKVRKVLFAGTV